MGIPMDEPAIGAIVEAGHSLLGRGSVQVVHLRKNLADGGRIAGDPRNSRTCSGETAANAVADRVRP
jgi:hypothetical protein